MEKPFRYIYDDVFYPKSLLKKVAADGGDVSGLPVITGTYSESSTFSARALSNEFFKWDVRDPADNKIVVPYGFHANYPINYKYRVIDILEKMNSDLGCIKTKHVPNYSKPPFYTNGIWMIFEDVSGTPKHCYSAMGKAPGFIGSANSEVSSITELGAPAGWQVMAFGTVAISQCDSFNELAIQHEMLHALG